MSKVIRDYFVFALLRFVIGPENSRTFSTNQIQNFNQARLGYSRFPALQAICLFSLPVLFGSSLCFPSYDWLLKSALFKSSNVNWNHVWCQNALIWGNQWF